MKRPSLFLPCAIAAFLPAVGACTQEGVGDDPTGSSGSASGGSAGNTTNPGTAGSAVSTTGGSVAAAGATVAGGNAAVSGSSSGGVGGSASVGGSGGGAAPTSGNGGSNAGGTGTAGAPAVTPASIVPTLDGYLWVGTCSGAGAGLDCTLNDEQNQCPNASAADYATRGVLRKAEHVVGGDKATKYTINFEVRGIVGGKFYTGGKLRTTTYSANGPNDGWYEGGMPTDSKWNTWEIRVDPPVAGAPNVYYLNAFDTASQYDGWHGTFPMKFSASFPVMGGSKLTLVVHDSNCLGQQNCGETPKAGQATCEAPRSVDLSGMMPQPTNFVQPYTQAAGGLHPQWLFVDVTSVTAG
jgi:hypothetical protein